MSVCGSVLVRDLNGSHVRSVMAMWEKSGRSWRYLRHLALRAWLREFSKHGAVDLVPLVTKVPSPNPRTVAPTEAEMEIFRSIPDLPTRWMVLLCSEAGLRAGAAVGLTLANFHGGNIHTVTKRGRGVFVPASAGILRLLMCLPPGADQNKPIVELLEGANPVRLHRQLVTRRLQAWAKEQGITRRVTFHDMRRGLARKLFGLTGDMQAVQSLLSHQSLASTFWYLAGGNTPLTADILNQAVRRKA